MHPTILQFAPVAWPEQVANLIQKRLSDILQERGSCSVMLTGGRSAERLYAAWAGLPGFQQMSCVQFYFGDERCVSPEHSESNYGMVMRTLFARGVPDGCSVSRMEAEDINREEAALRYEQGLPQGVDILLLGVGEDGHIASLFPQHAMLKEVVRRVMPVTGPKPPFDRLTITPSVVTQAGAIFVLAAGGVKAQILANALQMPEDFDTMPARLALKNAIWLLDVDY